MLKGKVLIQSVIGPVLQNNGLSILNNADVGNAPIVERGLKEFTSSNIKRIVMYTQIKFLDAIKHEIEVSRGRESISLRRTDKKREIAFRHGLEEAVKWWLVEQKLLANPSVPVAFDNTLHNEMMKLIYG